ncbi:polynucleotide adenylyltransferase [Neokomagataea thailandica NBRC 106555]|uniref:CCA tRNA nucleotidyltransferase n=2 Tax=Neokomagataea TaxID=1223423 RepID=A0A4Y6V6A2_9PROT|nr:MULTISPECIES: CCA tRNA nucleotidyltransferase [Neokomagataea]QDH24170.1 CCA tRNA nucleotidyltransferase [Neokomagataea tanensis]GBR50593.1 polynucleotide adenylyltransferase [Neokomagataea thailandica NBRC 106555]
MKHVSGLLEKLPRETGGCAGLAQIWAVLPEARLVGGCVRDLLCGRTLHDFDLATPEPPERVLGLLKAADIRAVPTGLEHGTVTAVIQHTPYEITTLRRDAETDGRHAIVEWTSDWAEDAARRDFTINAMSLDQHDILHDYFGGQEDLIAKRVRFVGDAAQRIKEDALRSLRFFRFEARYGAGDADDEALSAIKARAQLVGNLSVERIASELLKILAGPDVLRIVKIMAQAGVLAECGIPDVSSFDVQSGLARLEALLRTGAPANGLLRLKAFFAAQAEGLAQNLKFSNADKLYLKRMDESQPELSPEMDDDALRRARFLQDSAILQGRAWLIQAAQNVGKIESWDNLRERLAALPQPVFPLSGQDARQAGIEPGPAMGAWLRAGQVWWLSQGCRPDSAECLSYLQSEATRNFVL